MSQDAPLKPEVIIPGWVQGRGTPGDGSEDDALLEFIAWLMDRALPIPGTRFRVGLDALMGLVPIGGDALASLIQAGVVLTAVTRYEVPRAVAARMIANVLLDLGLGSIPIAGDLFDVAFKANTRNLALLREARVFKQKGFPMPAAPSRRYLIALAAALLGGILILALGFIALATWIVKLVWNAGG